jgi:hypothetical protein
MRPGRHHLGLPRRLRRNPQPGAPSEHPDEVVNRLATIGHKHIMRGILTVDLARDASRLLGQMPLPDEGRESR